MRKSNSAQENAEKGRILYDAIQLGLSFTAAVIRTNVFDLTTTKDSADALHTTLRLLEATDHSQKDETIKKAKQDVRQAIGRMGFLASPKRAKQLDDMLDREAQMDEKTSSASNAFARHSDTHYYAPVDRTAARVTRIKKRK